MKQLTLPTGRALEKFWSRIDRSGGPHACWPWQGYIGSHGYGRMTINYRDWLAHRLVWMLAHGAIPKGLWVLHHCDNPPCCNPAHLWLGTTQDNTADRDAKGRHGYSVCKTYHRGAEHWSAKQPDRVLRGERVPTARLTEVDVRSIRTRRACGESFPEIAARYGVTKQAIWRIVNRIAWAHVE